MPFSMPTKPMLLAAACFACTFPGMTFAQGKRNRNADREKLPANGKLLGAGRGIIQVQTEDGGQWLIMVRGAQALSVGGKAEAGWLRPGMLVKFSSQFDKKGKAVAPIKELSVVTMREGMRFGMVPENLRSSVGGGGGGAGLFSDPDEKKVIKKPTRPKPIKPEDLTYTVVGKIAKIRKGEVSIAAGRLLKFEFAESPRIDVDVADISVAKQGDSVSMEGYYSAKQPGRGIATRFTVALENTLMGPKKVFPGATQATEPKEGEAEEGGKDDGEKEKAEGEKQGDPEKGDQ